LEFTRQSLCRTVVKRDGPDIFTDLKTRHAVLVSLWPAEVKKEPGRLVAQVERLLLLRRLRSGGAGDLMKPPALEPLRAPVDAVISEIMNIAQVADYLHTHPSTI